MNAEIVKRISQARNLTEARQVLKEYRAELNSSIQADIQERMQSGSPSLYPNKSLVDELAEVNVALRDAGSEDGAQ